jgi:glycosyl transferase family 2
MKISYSFASRSRPEKFFAALDNIREMSVIKDYEIIAKLDIDDLSMHNNEVKNKLTKYPEVTVKWGLSENKIHAINRDNNFSGEIICCHSDDMVFIKKGFDDVIRREIEKDFYLHFPDGYANERLSTYSIMHVNYYKRFGYIYHPQYKNLWCDNEQMDVAKKLYRYKYVGEQIFEHRHPSAGKAQKDEQYRLTESSNSVDKTTYLKRKKINFDLPQKTLSILICSLQDRKEYLLRLINTLKPQLSPEVEVKLCIDNRQATTGEKRNDLLESATGKYVVFIDDDDLVSNDYIESILQAAKQDTDVIVFKGWMTTNGRNKQSFSLSKDHPYTTTKDGVYLRYPNHIVPIRASIAKQFRFPGKVFGEDYVWATLIHNSRLIKTETKIDKDLYYYLFNSKS